MPDTIDLDELLRWEICGPQFSPAARYAVIGSPVKHSKSPQMHNPALIEAGVPAQYIRVEVPPGQVRAAFEAFRANGFRGINITIPHKLEALECVDDVDPLALQLGAVNTVVISPDGKLTGFNTDGPGVVRAVNEAFGQPLTELSVLILGAGGGAGRATAVQCALSHCPALVLANRTQTKTETLLSELRLLPGPLPSLHSSLTDDASLISALDSVDLIINATSIGMKADDAPPLPLAHLQPHHRVFDMVYRADGSATPLVAAAQAVGARWTDGLNLLLHQGALSFEHWHQRPAPLDAMRKGLLATLKR